MKRHIVFDMNLTDDLIKENISEEQNWGMFANSQDAAYQLALLFGCTEVSPEISKHLDIAYWHYNDKSRIIHIWFE